MSRIFLLEDDMDLLDGLQYVLRKEGFDVETARTIRQAKLQLIDPARYDLLLLDVSLPDGTGFALCEWIRSRNPRVPVLFLTALDEETDVIRGLDCGGDDYITKPFKTGELCSRIRAALRRAGTQAQTQPGALQSGALSIDLVARSVFWNGRPLELTGAEYRLLCLLVKNADCTVPRERILNALWDNAGNFVDDNTLSVYIRRLREKMEADPSHPQHILTVRGFGYRWREGSDGHES